MIAWRPVKPLRSLTRWSLQKLCLLIAWKKNEQRNIFMYGGLGILVVTASLWNRLRYIRKSRAIIKKEKDRSENLLLNILPAEIAEELKVNGRAEARDFELVTILFTDFKEFTRMSEKMSAKELVSE